MTDKGKAGNFVRKLEENRRRMTVRSSKWEAYNRTRNKLKKVEAKKSDNSVAFPKPRYVLPRGRPALMVPSLVLLITFFPANVFGQVTGNLNEAGGVYPQNATLYFRNSPFLVSRDMVVEAGVRLTIETGVKLYFKPGIGLKVHGTLYAVGGAYSRIQMLPHQESANYDPQFPFFRLIDGPSTRQGRLQVFFKDRWRSICSQNTNWTYTDYSAACKGMGFGGGSFWRWFRRNNDTHPFVMPRPGCSTTDRSLSSCSNFSTPSRIPLSENLCQGEDDVGLVCWGPPTFDGWKRHWKGLQFVSVPFGLVEEDPNHVTAKKESWSRLEYVDILYAGYDRTTKNSTAAVWVQGTPPFINEIHVIRSARDGIRIIDPDGPVLIANSTIRHNRGHGIVIDNTTDGRVFINETRVEGNYGDGIRYRQKGGTVLTPILFRSNMNGRKKRQTPYYEPETPELNFCSEYELRNNVYFPRFVHAKLENGTLIGQGLYPCHLAVNLPPYLQYTYTIQFVEIENKNPPSETRTELRICSANQDQVSCRANEFHRTIPILDGVLPQSVSVPNDKGLPLWLGMSHVGAVNGRMLGTVDVKLRIHATVKGSIFYGLNITNSRITDNWGRGVLAQDVRDRVTVTNTTISTNQYIGLQVLNGAADVWINASHLDQNYNDGINVSYVGGSILVNGTSLRSNRMRGAAFHQNDSSPFMALSQSIQFRGRPSLRFTNLRTVVEDNWWGGILVGNFCKSALSPISNPGVFINYVEFIANRYHPSFEYHSCQRVNQSITHVDFGGNRCERGTGFCLRVQPAVNIQLDVKNSFFLNNSRSAMIIRNREHPQLRHLPANVEIQKNEFKFNRGPFIVSVGLNEDAPSQSMIFDYQNDLSSNTVINPYPHLNPRTTPYAVIIVSSSNVQLTRNCFRNQLADYEIATDLPEHAKVINAKENNWGSGNYNEFILKIFDQFYRFSLASFDISTFALYCNQQNPEIRQPNSDQARTFERSKFVLGGKIFQNTDLGIGTYTIVDDLQILPGAKLNLVGGTTLQFENGIGMLIQGELTRRESFSGMEEEVLFTKAPFEFPKEGGNLRLVDFEMDSKTPATSGRLEVMIDNQWGTVCNRSWTVSLAMKACHQMGLALDPEFIENWRLYPQPGNLPMLMDNIRCEEMEWDLTKCRHDGVDRHINASCRRDEVVGIRCVEPRWAGVRYSLLANPPITTRVAEMHHWTIEQAGLFDWALPEFCAALQIDWNYHAFSHLKIRDNFWNGLDIVYNDLTKKPIIENSEFVRNRRNGIRIRSVGVTIQHVRIADNENAGLRYNPIISHRLQQDVITWLDQLDSVGQTYNNVIFVPRQSLVTLPNLSPSSLGHRRFLVAKATADCPLAPVRPCNYAMTITAGENVGGYYGYIGVQIVNRPHNDTDEDMIFQSGTVSYSARHDTIKFPFVTLTRNLRILYTRSYGDPGIVVLLFFMNSAEYLDRFVHVHRSEISNNQYAISTLHYSNFTHWDGSHINRWENEKLWFQKINFTENKQAVIWVNGPLRDVYSESPIAEITYHVDNCSIIRNNGSIIETHRDLHSSANVFKWKVWSSTFRLNDQSGISITLPDTYNLLSLQHHEFNVTESRFEHNQGFQFELAGYFAKVNISSNNFTNNHARTDSGLMILRGMEKELVMEKNRWELNQGTWMLKYDIQSQTIQRYSRVNDSVPARIRYNYFTGNYFGNFSTELLISYPRSYTLGILGLQKVVVNYNRFYNFELDFEIVVGLKGSQITDSSDIRYNWWGVSSQAGILQRIFDFDDWNIYSVGDVNPYFTNQERFINWQWKPSEGQLGTISYVSPSPYDLKGRLFDSVTLKREREQWPESPYYYKPDRPYRITKDLTIMPTATLTIEKGVEVHLYPNVRILVLGSLIAEGTFWEPIRFKPINVTELDAAIIDIRSSRQRREIPAEKLEVANPREKRDIIYREFPLLQRQDSFYQKFNVFLVGIGNVNNQSGFLEIYNATTGEMVPICDRQFTRRNAQVVCRELGHATRNAYSWVRPRWSYDPKIRIVKSYSEPRQCVGTEKRLSDCDLRLNGDRDMWYCTDSEHSVFIHCGDSKNLNHHFLGHWGGFVFSAPSLEQHNDAKESVMKNVEIVGAGFPHNDSGVALTMIYQTPVLEFVNITNSSMHGIQILAPRNKVELKNLNVTDNSGLGLNILSLNLQRSDSSSGTQLRNLSIPYHLFGMLDMCSVGREIDVQSRILVYYKYDSYPVDCVKYFKTNIPVRHIGFRILQGNLYNARDPAGRPDALRFYQDKRFSKENMIAEFLTNTLEDLGRVVQSTTQILGVHMRANAADGRFGFIAEVALLPAAPEQAPVTSVTIANSRFANNDRGAIHYSSAGELSPELIFDSCYIGRNGKHIWGNFSTSESAVELDLHNTQRMRFVNSMVWKNQGGLQIQVYSSSAISRLSGLIKNSIFAQNEYFETLRIVGKHYQEMAIINNYFGKNRARYHDIVFVNRMTANFTHNIFYNNTGTHVVDMTGYLEYSQKDHQTFMNNFLFDNIALGHGYQFPERYGYLPEVQKRWISRRKRSVSLQFMIRRFRRDTRSRDLGFLRRWKRQHDHRFAYDGTSFEWWANIGDDTDRYRSTVLAGNSKQVFHRNFFSNPENDYELTTMRKTEYDTSNAPLDARYNYWGYPGTDGVAQGKIRDQQDYAYLVPVDYKPVLESNTSLIQGNCPAGWFQAGVEAFKSCFLYVPGVMTHNDAVKFCEDQGAFIPYFRKSDKRISDVAANVDRMNTMYIQDMEKYSSYPHTTESRMWVGGVQVPADTCGYLSSSTGKIHAVNCGLLLPFVCEQGRKAYQPPFLWRGAGIAVIIAAIILLFLILALIVGWWYKSRKRKEQFLERKNSLRASIRSNKMTQERIKEEQRMHEFERQKIPPPRPPSPDLIAAHKQMVLGHQSSESLSSLKKKFGSSSSVSTGVTDTTSSYPMKKNSPTYSESAYQTQTDYSPSNDSYYSNGTRAASTKFNYSGTPSGRNDREAKDRGDVTPSLSSFRGGTTKSSSVVYRKEPGKGSGRRHDTTTSEATTCSTCPTESVVSYDQTGTEYSRESRGTSYTGSTVTEPSTARSSGTVTETDTINDERSSIYEKPRRSELLTSPARMRAPVYHSGSSSFLEEDDKDYMQARMSPMAHLQGYTPKVPPRPTPGRPPRFPPPPVPVHQNSVPNLAYPESSQSQDSLMDLTSRMDPSRSMGNLDSTSSGNNWRPPNLSSFSRASTATQGQYDRSKDRGIPLETAM